MRLRVFSSIVIAIVFILRSIVQKVRFTQSSRICDPRKDGDLVMETLWQELRFGLRMLRNSPAFALVAIFSLALGIGANTAIFSLIDQVILRSLPVRSPEQLVLLGSQGPYWGLNLGPNSFSYP